MLRADFRLRLDCFFDQSRVFGVRQSGSRRHEWAIGIDHGFVIASACAVYICIHCFTIAAAKLGGMWSNFWIAEVQEPVTHGNTIVKISSSPVVHFEFENCLLLAPRLNELTVLVVKLSILSRIDNLLKPLRLAMDTLPPRVAFPVLVDIFGPLIILL